MTDIDSYTLLFKVMSFQFAIMNNFISLANIQALNGVFVIDIKQYSPSNRISVLHLEYSWDNY